MTVWICEDCNIVFADLCGIESDVMECVCGVEAKPCNDYKIEKIEVRR